MNKPSMLIISFSDMKNDPRVFRQLKLFKDYFQVTAIGFKDPEFEGVDFHHIIVKNKTPLRNLKRALFLKTRMFNKYYSETFDSDTLLQSFKDVRFDVVIANDNDSLPLSFMIDDGKKVIHDAHEYSPRQYDDQMSWRFFMKGYREWVCSTYLARCAQLITVSEGVAEEYQRSFGVHPIIITNATDFVDITPSVVDGRAIKIIHHGSANRSRNLEILIEMVTYLDTRFSLFLMLLPVDKKYYKELKKASEGNDRIKFVNPVSMNEIVNVTNQYDIGIFISKPVNFNLLHVLPNKFFEFIQARLAVAIGPSPEMVRYVTKFDCGVVCSNFSAKAMAETLNGLTADRIRYYKAQSNMAAKELSSEENMKTLKEIVEGIIGK